MKLSITMYIEKGTQVVSYFTNFKISTNLIISLVTLLGIFSLEVEDLLHRSILQNYLLFE